MPCQVGGLELDEGGLTKAVVSTIGDMDAPMLPDAQVGPWAASLCHTVACGRRLGWCAARWINSCWGVVWR
eukprot:SAG25_NODE_5671_length_633_cov_0.876404_1_plen_70_part_10